MVRGHSWGGRKAVPDRHLPSAVPASSRHPPGIFSAPGLTLILGTSMSQDKAEGQAGRMIRFEGTGMQGVHRRRNFTLSLH